MKRFFCLLLCAVTAFCCTCCTKDTLSRERKEELLEKAYVFTLPLMIMDAAVTKMTNTETANSASAPINQFSHAKNLADADYKSAEAPNADALCSQMFMDLGKDAVIIELPKTDRYCTVEVLDAYTNCIKIIDCTSFKNSSEKFIFKLADFSGKFPKEWKKINCPTPINWVIVRTVCDSKADEKNVDKIQEKMDSYTYSQYKEKTTAKKERGSYKESNNIIPIEYVNSLSLEDYFIKANELMAYNLPAKEDAEFLAEIKKINVGPSCNFKPAIFGDDFKDYWTNLSKDLAKTALKKSADFIPQNGIWQSFEEPIAEFGTEYYYRALIASCGFGASPVSVSVCSQAETDSSGEKLNGKYKYTLHFEKEQIPPVEKGGFWSVTAYGKNNYLIDNVIDRYCISSRNDLEFNKDGSLDIMLQEERPQGDERNWLPIGKNEFYLVLRIYSPARSVTAGAYTAPSIEKVRAKKVDSQKNA
jgi:hypothetical protein